MSELIGGKHPPKWVTDGTYELGGETRSITEGMEAEPSEAIKILEENKEKIKRTGLCIKCRTRPCLCNEGQ